MFLERRTGGFPENIDSKDLDYFCLEILLL